MTEGPIPTISLEFEHPAYDEVGTTKTLADFAGYDLDARRAMCRMADFELYPKAIWHSEDPTTSGNEIPRLLLARSTSPELKVVLTGEGSDEVLGGYWWYRLDRLLRPLARLPLAARRAMLLGPVLSSRRPWTAGVLLAPREMGLDRYAAMIGPRHQGIQDRLLAPDYRRRVAAEEADSSRESGAAVPASRLERRHPFEQLQYVEMKTRLPDFINQKLDRQSMTYSVEPRVPFLDHEVVEYCATIPPALKMRGLREKHVLREALRRDLPAELVGRRKRGLAAPYRQWLRGDLPGFARDLLSVESLKRKGYFDAPAGADLMSSHRSGADDYGEQLPGVLAIQLWDELFVCRRGPGDLSVEAV